MAMEMDEAAAAKAALTGVMDQVSTAWNQAMGDVLACREARGGESHPESEREACIVCGWAWPVLAALG